MNMEFPQFLTTVMYMAIIYLHLARKTSGVAIAYGVQSFAVVLLLVNAYVTTKSATFLFIAILGLMVKVILAPLFIIHLIKKHELKFLISTYANIPITLIIVAVLTAAAHSKTFTPLVTIIAAHRELLSLALSALFISLFLIVNRKGAVSQIVGILSLENSIVAFGLFSVIDQSLILEIGIVFSISVWIVIATIFISMVYKHFGTLDVTQMKNLKE
jgi:hydrogenase-4 component E